MSIRNSLPIKVNSFPVKRLKTSHQKDAALDSETFIPSPQDELQQLSSSQTVGPVGEPTPQEITSFHKLLDNKDSSQDEIAARLAENSGLLNAHHPEDGYTALIRTARDGQAGRVRQLLKAGADPLLPESKSMLALAGHKAAFMGHQDVIHELFQVDDETARKMLEVQGPKNGKTILMDALWIDRPGLPDEYQVKPEDVHRYVKIADMLVDKSLDLGADLSLKSHDGQSAKHMLEQLVEGHPQFRPVLEKMTGKPAFTEAAPVSLLMSDSELTEVQEASTSPLQQVVEKNFLPQAATYHRDQAYQMMDRLIAARDEVTGLLPLHVETQDGKLTATDHMASGLDMGRQTSGLVMVAELAKAEGDQERSKRYLEAAEANYQIGKKLLAQGDYFVQRRDFNPDGSVATTEVGEPGKSVTGEDNMSRVNPRAYAFRGVGELYRATGKPEYKDDFNRYFQAWVSDFHDSVHGGFFIHSNVEKAGDNTERGTFHGPGGQDTDFDGQSGVKGNDGAIYAMSSSLLLANEILATEQTQSLVREQMDIILDKMTVKNGMLWENYTADFQPISQDWQLQNRENGEASHVAIGGHTAMASQQVIEGARQLKEQGVLSASEYNRYVERAFDQFQDFASESGAVDWDTGAVHNAMRVEEPDRDKRWLDGWGDASWQQAELLQSLIRFKEEGLLGQLKGPEGRSGYELFMGAQQHYQQSYSLPEDYKFDGYFGNPDVYHVPQVASYFGDLVK